MMKENEDDNLPSSPKDPAETGSCCRCERPRGWIISPQAAPAWAAGLGNADAWNVLELETGEADWGEAEGVGFAGRGQAVEVGCERGLPVGERSWGRVRASSSSSTCQPVGGNTMQAFFFPLCFAAQR